MEPIQTALKKWMRESKNFQEHYQSMKQAILKDPEIQQILKQNPQLTDQDISKHLMKLYEYQSQSKRCQDCPALAECKNLVPGYSPLIHVANRDVRITYEMCPRKAQVEAQSKKRSFISSLYMPREVLEATFEEVDMDDDQRLKAIGYANNYVEKWGTKEAEKGLYFHGPFGVGKTFFLGAVANDLANEGVSSLVIYMPEFVREMKSSLQDNSLNKKIEQFKTTPVLMLDDIGAESMSSWFRDEVLGAILQYRMMERLPVFFTSNYTLKDLEKHLMTNNRGDVEELKAGRIIERIKQVSIPVPVHGQNRRS
ncbi:primosomal protein DnaI [Pontibacillus marinus]|uniref:Primosomal protein DnaI n=1 Tax=Pontibacillus marinus BH030004 = DSM 16465 TaxID=1385511 RepID=A0A0A5FXM7_9BACI|nr:primosomal protein DnaI [Pontibacillus marinus]KGX83565.1 primosomal protein DnaI [Pontibacillus marinus BH030004 = DSM 16465]